jgi:hypothetical protein
MRVSKSVLSGIILLVSTTARTEGTEKSWPGQMQALHRTIMGLLPLTTSDRLFADPKRRSEIEEKAKSLEALTASLKSLHAPGDNDPSTEILVELFAEHAERARSELKSGNRAYARGLLNSAPAFCVACHTRTNAGPDFSKLGVEAPVPLAGMTAIENARLLVATRQYGAAMKEYDVILHAIPEDGDGSGEWKSAVYGAVTLAVRVQGDPERTSEIIEHVLSRGFVARSFRIDVLRWKKTVEEWKKEPKRKDASAETLLVEMRRLYDRAKELQIAPKDRGGDLLYLRMSALGHEFLNRYPKSPVAGEVLFLLGVSYEVMQVWDLWTFHEVLYERCVRQFPKSEAAGKCLQRYEGSISDDYIGEKIPPALRARMRALEKLTEEKRP